MGAPHNIVWRTKDDSFLHLLLRSIREARAAWDEEEWVVIMPRKCEDQLYGVVNKALELNTKAQKEESE